MEEESNNGVDSNSDLTNHFLCDLGPHILPLCACFFIWERMDFVRTLLALRIGEQRYAEKVEGMEETGTFGSPGSKSCRGALSPPSPLLWAGSRSFPLAHLLTHLRLRLLRNMTPVVKISENAEAWPYGSSVWDLLAKEEGVSVQARTERGLDFWGPQASLRIIRAKMYWELTLCLELC